MDERNDKYLEFLMAIKGDVGKINGQVEQMNERLSGVEMSLQDVRAFQETYAVENARDHQTTAHELATLTEQGKQLQKNVNELNKNVEELRKKSGGPSIKAVDELLSFWVKWWKPITGFALFVGGVVVAWFK